MAQGRQSSVLRGKLAWGARALAIALATSTLFFSSEGTARAADYRCFYGPGIQFWIDSPPGTGATKTWILCGKNIQIGNFRDYVDNNQGNFWNDIISSYETFNLPANQVTALYTDFCGGGNELDTIGNVRVTSLNSTWNDKFSSLSLPKRSGGPC
jgi:hypothetical protein